jgi:DHA1 family multidrug resistance protein-like MFS transporter
MSADCLFLRANPRTLASTIVLRKARRLRKVTGNKDLQSQSEIDQANTKIKDVFKDALILPLRLLIEPAVFVVSLYLGLVYAIVSLIHSIFARTRDLHFTR